MQKQLMLAVCAAAALCGCADKQTAGEKITQTPSEHPAADITAAGAAPPEPLAPSPDEISAAERAAQEQEAKRIAQEQEAQRIAQEQEAQRLAQEQEAQRLAQEQEAQRIAQEQEAQRIAQEQEAQRLAQEQEAKKAADIVPSTKMAYSELVGNDGSDDKPQPPPAGTYTLEIDVTNNVAKVFASSGGIVRMMLCTTGEAETPTPTGTFKMGRQKERFGHFSEYDCYAQYWSQINGDIFVHSVLYEERAADTLIKSSYKNLGRASSHGCVRMTVPDARWIYENLAPGTLCTVKKAPRDDALKKSLKLPKPD